MEKQRVQTPDESTPYAIEMLHITKRFPGIIANDDITLQLRHGEIHALLGENGAGKSTLMSVLFGLYQPEEGEIRKDGKTVSIRNPNDATALGIGMVHQHFKLVECFTVLDNIILGVEPTKFGFLQKKEARQKVLALSERYGLHVDPDAKVEDITVGMQQRTEILKMLYRDNEILIFDEPTAVLTPQEIDELMQIMRNLAAEGKSILFISHKLAEIMAVSDRCTVLRKGKYIGTVNTKDTTPEELSAMMVGRNVNFHVEKKPAQPGEVVLKVENMTVASHVHKNNAVKNVSLEVRAGEIVCLAGIDGNGQTEFVYGLTGLEPLVSGKIYLDGQNITRASIRRRSMSGGNQQKAIVAREIDRSPHLLIAMQPTRGLDVGAIEYIHKQIIAARDEGKAVLLVSLEMDEVLDVSDRILVMYEGEIVGELDPKTTTAEEIGLYMAGAKREVR